MKSFKDDLEFKRRLIRTWEASASVEEAAREMGLTPHTLKVRVIELRYRGFKLKSFGAGDL